MSKSRDKKYKEYRANQAECKNAHMKAESAQTVEELYDYKYKKIRTDAEFQRIYDAMYDEWHYVDEQGRDRIKPSFHDYSHRDYTKGSSYVHDSWQESNDLYYSNKSDFPKDECPMNRKIDPNTKFMK